ncbi:ThuA domain-containing protein [Zobellia galactanivorans]|uniref:ThuA domain-containing protein n=1 Tax=Zobellia galactanivorans (strain DSM 12802 / CCUG 47099 / CIP 106680 / NCIMB 13871 / Dsij) TaxID=63186 RepID=UPI0026E32946|nr:ThuA domain-containing protein [Zobellia galactanivorans]MDO6809278.1 ThuA domain-containing protein [Zobellia galactanivorans]
MKERPLVGLLSALFVCIYFFFVACEKDKSDDAVTVATDVEAPHPPKNLEPVHVTDSSVTVAWQASKDNVKVVQYVVYLDSVEVSRDSITTYHAKNLKAATEYIFAVRAADAAGNSSKFSEKIKVLTEAAVQEDTLIKNDTLNDYSSVLMAPILSVDSVSSNMVRLKWALDINASAVKEYRVFQDTVQIASVDRKWYQVPQLNAGDTYSFSVAAIDLIGKASKPSNVVEVELPLEELPQKDTISPSVPVGLGVAEVKKNGLKLYWQAATDNVGVTSYSVYKDTTLVGKVGDTLLLLDNLEGGTEYHFRVSALDAAENESQSSEALLVKTLEDTKTDSIVLRAPKDVRLAELGATTASFTWSETNDSIPISGYSVYLDAALVAKTPEPEYMAKELSPNTAYAISVVANDNSGNTSEKSDPLSFTTLSERVVSKDTIAPTVPKNISVEALTSSSLKLNWAASTDSVGVVNYRIFQDGKPITLVVDTHYAITGLDADTEYVYTISALDAAENESPASVPFSVRTEKEEAQEEEDTTAPTVPGSLTADTIGQVAIDLSWDEASDSVGVSGYKLYMNGEFFATVTQTRYRVLNLTPGTEYAFSVSAFDVAENESQQSGLLKVTTEAEVYVDDVPPSTPGDLRAEDITEGSVALSWSTATDNIGITEYIIYQDGQKIQTATATGTSINGLAPATLYGFTVSAVDAAQNESRQSEAIRVTTLPIPETTDRVLVFTKTSVFRHGSIDKGVATLKALGDANDFEVDQTENGDDFTLNNLRRYKTVVFLNTTGDVLNDVQQKAFENYIRSGGSFMGVHAATDTEYDWPWYGKLVGAYFNGHPSIQEASLNVIDHNHGSTSHLPSNWVRTEEWYNFKDINTDITPLIQLDESTYKGGTNGAYHPFSWYHVYDGGRAFYTAGGHSNASYDEPEFKQHLLGGLIYCLGR